MPDWKAHVIATLLVYALIIWIFPTSPEFGLLALMVFLFFGVLPDLDHPKSLVRQLLTVFCALLLSVAVFIRASEGLELRLASSLIVFALVFLLFRYLPLSHRGKRSLHKWGIGLGLFLVCVVLFLALGLSPYLSLFALLGYWLHLGLDRLKYKGRR